MECVTQNDDHLKFHVFEILIAKVFRERDIHSGSRQLFFY